MATTSAAIYSHAATVGYAYKVATFVLLAVTLLFLPIVLFTLAKWCKKKRREYQRSRHNGIVTIGRKRNNIQLQGKVNYR